MKKSKQRSPVVLKRNDRGRIKLSISLLSNSAGEAIIARGGLTDIYPDGSSHHGQVPSGPGGSDDGEESQA